MVALDSLFTFQWAAGWAQNDIGDGLFELSVQKVPN